jgi:microcystin-dependent protein
MAEPFIGEIRMFGFNFTPREWASCSGAIVSISQNQALFALIGDFYGGDGRVSMALPDLRGRSPINSGSSPLGAYPIGAAVGQTRVLLAKNQLPIDGYDATFTPVGGSSTSVTLDATTDLGDMAKPVAGAYLAQTKATGGAGDKPENIYKGTPTAGSLVALGGVKVASSGGDGTVAITNIGGSQPIDIRNPTLALNFCIALQGIFPSRN